MGVLSDVLSARMASPERLEPPERAPRVSNLDATVLAMPALTLSSKLFQVISKPAATFMAKH